MKNAIDGFDLKLKLATQKRKKGFESEGTSIKNLSEESLIENLRVTKDYYYRLRRGSRPLNQGIFDKVCAFTNVESALWELDVVAFGHKLGFTRREISQITGLVLPGIDFASRNKDNSQIKNIHKLIQGYWEVYYHSVSRTDQLEINRDLCIIKDINDDGYIECRLSDTLYNYSGWCFAFPNHLYFTLEKEEIRNELVFYCTNIPHVFPAELLGIIQCISGSGTGDIFPHPSAAKVAFRFIGRTIDEAINETKETYGETLKSSVIQGENPENILREVVPAKIDPNNSITEKEKQIFLQIHNLIEAQQLPFSLIG